MRTGQIWLPGFYVCSRGLIWMGRGGFRLILSFIHWTSQSQSSLLQSQDTILARENLLCPCGIIFLGAWYLNQKKIITNQNGRLFSQCLQHCFQLRELFVNHVRISVTGRLWDVRKLKCLLPGLLQKKFAGLWSSHSN